MDMCLPRIDKGDERILGGGEFVQKVLEMADEEFEQSTRLQNRGLSLDSLLWEN